MFDWEVLSEDKNLLSLKKSIISHRFGNDAETDVLNIPEPIIFLKNNYFDSSFNENVKKAKEIVNEAIQNNTLIIIHGDYDCDGVCATTIIYRTIRDHLNYKNCEYVIPDRFNDGYGLSNNSLKRIYEISFNQPFLLITVDCGISSFHQIEEIKSLGNKVILTDHHHKPDIVPNADAVIWSDKVVGSTLSWVLALSLGNKDPKFLTYASIATISDVFPLKEMNRSLVKHGIEILKKQPPAAIKELLKNANKDFKEISTYDLGFVIGPRLNSSGRIGSADFSIELMVQDNEDEISKFSREIEEINKKRQSVTEESLKKLQIDPINLPKILVIYHPEFHEGVMGLIASKIVGKYNRPALVISDNEGHLKGSARSIKGINIIDILTLFKEDFISVGGHELAAGFSLKKENLESLKEKLSNYMENKFDNFSFNKKILIESNIPLEMVNLETLSFINNLEPFGPSNEEPILSSKSVRISGISFIGKDKNHLSLVLQDGDFQKRGVLFNFDKKFQDLFLGQEVDIAYKIRKNEYNGKVSAELNIVDIKIHE